MDGVDRVRFLALADLHLGRVATLPSGWERSLSSPEAAWERAVAWTILPENRIDALLLAGDLFDREEDFFEGCRPFERGLRGLLDAKIPVVLVAGNHDYWLPRRLKERLSHPLLFILGEGEKWSFVELELRGSKVRIDGWSFQAAHHQRSPLSTYQLPPPQAETLLLGLLHADLLAKREGVFAPVTLREFAKMPHSAWVLGHVHERREYEAPATLFYPGSPYPLDNSERGERGALLLELDAGGKSHPSFVPLASLLYLPIELECSGEGFSWEERLQESLRTYLTLHPLPDLTVALGLHLTLTGRTSNSRELLAQVAASLGREIPPLWIEGRGGCKAPAPRKIDDFGVRCQSQLAGSCCSDEIIPERVGEEEQRQGTPKGRFCWGLGFCNCLGRELQLFVSSVESQLKPLWSLQLEGAPKDPPSFLAQMVEGADSQFLESARNWLLAEKAAKASFRELGDEEITLEEVRALLTEVGTETLDLWLGGTK